jgi:hypothetical protein
MKEAASVKWKSAFADKSAETLASGSGYCPHVVHCITVKMISEHNARVLAERQPQY